MNWRWIWITSLLGALIIAYGALMGRGRTPSLVSEVPQRPAYYLRNAVITETQADGSMATRLTAKHIELQPSTDDLSMSDVLLHYVQSPEQQWRLTAQSAFKPGDSAIMKFAGDVQLRPAEGDAQDVLQAEELAIDTQNDVAFSTRSPVRIRYGRHTMDVESFRFDMNNETLRMRSAKGTYDRS